MNTFTKLQSALPQVALSSTAGAASGGNQSLIFHLKRTATTTERFPSLRKLRVPSAWKQILSFPQE